MGAAGTGGLRPLDAPRTGEENEAGEGATFYCRAKATTLGPTAAEHSFGAR